MPAPSPPDPTSPPILVGLDALQRMAWEGHRGPGRGDSGTLEFEPHPSSHCGDVGARDRRCRGNISAPKLPESRHEDLVLVMYEDV